MPSELHVKIELSKVELTVARTMRSVHFTCGCFAEYSSPSPYKVPDKDGNEVATRYWNPQPCREHKTPEARQAIVKAAQEAILADVMELLHATPI